MARAAVDAPPANGGTCCHATKGLGYATSLEAMEKGPREKLVYITCVYNGTGINKLDYLATMDLDPDSPTYSQVIHRLSVTHIGDELHHSGWNSCSSCHGDPSAKHRFLILPSLLAPSLHNVFEYKDIAEKTGLGFPHTSHCLASGDIMISCLGDKEGNTTGNGFLLLDSEFNVKGRWEKPGHSPLFGYDFWYQPHHKTMISSSWGAPAAFRTCFNPQHVAISIKPLKVRNWFLPEMPGLITDFVISLDDRYHYLVHWLHGDIRQYNIEDPAKPFLAGQVWVGGLLPKGGDVVYVTDDSQEEQYNVPQVK
ncbi:hypothetical protein ACJX0J_035668, partial [Zea mays]